MRGPIIKLLVVEDNPDQRLLTRFAFKKREAEIQIVEVDNGAGALEQLKSGAFDLIILDYSLPRMNGLDVLSETRRLGIETPVIMVTGQGDEKIAVEAMKRGAADYVIKTINYHETLPILLDKVLEANRLQHRLAAATIRARRLYEISLQVAKERQFDGLTGTLVEGARQLLDAEAALFLLTENDGNTIRRIRAAGLALEGDFIGNPMASLGLFGAGAGELGPLRLEDVRHDPLWKVTPRHTPEVRHLAGVPMAWAGGARGKLFVFRVGENEPFRDDELDSLSTLALHAGSAIDNVHYLQEVSTQAITDSLTGIFNHQEFQKRLEEELKKSAQGRGVFSLLMMDIDYFKEFNDTHGHPAGDAALKQLVGVIRNSIRNVDIPARYGGEEFAVILTGTQSENAVIAAERIRSGVERDRFALPSGDSARLSISIGIASYPGDADTREGLIHLADRALYAAKRGGRNRVVRFGDMEKSEAG